MPAGCVSACVFFLLCCFRQILVFLGSFADVPTFFYAASSGGPLGELVQWTDVFASIYLLGHDLTVSAATKNLPR